MLFRSRQINLAALVPELFAHLGKACVNFRIGNLGSGHALFRLGFAEAAPHPAQLGWVALSLKGRGIGGQEAVGVLPPGELAHFLAPSAGKVWS